MSEAGDLRMVTVLVTDIVDSTPIGEQLGPERSKPLFDEVSRLLATQVERFGGTVAQHTGDGLLAFFGAPTAHGDDAERAVRSALAIIAALEPFAREVESAYGVSLAARVAINTGTAAVPRGDQALDALYNALGDTVTVAGRLQSFADPGGVIVGPVTAAELDDQFDFESVGPLELKGKTEAVPAFRVTGERSESVASLTTLIGRDRELSILQDALADVVDERGGVVVITGEPGIGKSRLIAEARAGRPEVMFFEGHGASYQESAPYWPVHELLRRWLGLELGAPALQVRLELKAALRRVLGDAAESAYPFVAMLLGVPLEPDQQENLRDVCADSIQQQTFEAFESVLVAEARQRPVCVIFDDLHWADDATLALIEHLLMLTDEHALVVVLAYRTEREHAAWALGDYARSKFPHRFRVIDLAALSGESSAALAVGAAGAELPAEVSALLSERCGGNPFFIEQAVLELVECGSLARINGRFELTGSFATGSVPVRIQETLQARLDRLDVGDREVVTAASVIGRSFGLPLLEQVVSDEQLIRRLATLQRLELIEEQRRRPVLEYQFRHGLVREVAYASLLDQPRRALHQQVGEALERADADGLSADTGLLAGHFAQAGDAPRAADYLLKAGAHARSVFAEREAVEYYEQALPFLRELGDVARERTTQFTLALTHFTAYDFGAANAAYQAAFALPAPLPVVAEPTETFTLPSVEPGSLVAGVGYADPEWWLVSHVFRGLFRLDRDSAVQPDLARGFTVSEDGTAITVEIGDGYFWHDGVRVTADDFAFAWEEGRRLQFESSHLLHPITRVWAESPQTLMFTLDRPIAHLPYLLSIPPSFPWPSHLGAPTVDGSAIRVKPLGNGPYLVSEWDDTQIVLESTPMWTRDRGNVRRVKVDLVAAKDLPLVTDKFDLNPAPYIIGHTLDDRQLMVTTRIDHSTSLAFRTDRAPLDDRRVRLALALAFDRSRLELDRAGVPAMGGVIPPSLPGHLHDSGLTFDPAKAAALLSEAGFPGGRGLRPIGLLASDEALQTSATIGGLTEAWAALGIDVDVRAVAFRDYQGSLGEGSDAFLLPWIADFPDPEGMLGSFLTTYEGLIYSDRTVRELEGRARASRNRVERLDLYRQLDRYLVAEQVAIVPLSYQVSCEVVRPWVHGYWHTPMVRGTSDDLMIVDRPVSSE